MTITPLKALSGSISLPGDKSISHRAIMISAISQGKSTIKNFLASEDCIHTIKAFQALSIDISINKDTVSVQGKGLRGLSAPTADIYLGNSGTSMRLISGILAGQTFRSTLTGDESLSNRPMYRIIEPLKLMGADIKGGRDNCAPLTINGSKLKSISYKTKVASAQVKSAVMLAALYADGVTEIDEPVKSRDHTERMLSLFGGKLEIDDTKVKVYNAPDLKARSLTIPGDISSAAFFIVGALLVKGSKLEINGLLYNRTRLGFIDALNKMGADIKIRNKQFNGYEEVCDCIVESRGLKGIVIEKNVVPSLIDELPILMVAASLAEGETIIRGAGELRIKETDRINSMESTLKKMNANIKVKSNDIFIKGREQLKGAKMTSHGDHRTAMSLVIAALCAHGESQINGVECINTSFPGFFSTLQSISVR